MNMRDLPMIRVAALAAAVTVLVACSGIPKRESDAETVQRYLQYADLPVDHFSKLGGITGWQSLDRDQLVVWVGVNNAQLLRVQGPCEDLRFANTIGLTSTGSTVTTFDSVLVGRDRCRILEIRPVDYKRMKQDMREEKAEEKSDTKSY